MQAALKVHPYLKTVLFYDDSFMAISLRELTEFATRWREEVGIEFCIYGVIPTYVQRDKVEILTWAGMNRVRMGIQSGSERILKFYKRPTPVARIEQAAAALAEFADYQINPSYDIIVDNPVETRQDVIDTLELIYRLKKPFTLNIFSLRVIPNTSLEQQMIAEGFDVEQINENYTALRPTWANVLLYVLMVWTPPRKLLRPLADESPRVQRAAEVVSDPHPPRAHPVADPAGTAASQARRVLGHHRLSRLHPLAHRSAEADQEALQPQAGAVGREVGRAHRS